MYGRLCRFEINENGVFVNARAEEERAKRGLESKDTCVTL